MRSRVRVLTGLLFDGHLGVLELIRPLSVRLLCLDSAFFFRLEGRWLLLLSEFSILGNEPSHSHGTRAGPLMDIKLG
jgi:hypothetical protein